MDKNFAQKHPVDNSALIHLALHNAWHSNCFRLTARLKSYVRQAKLQKAVERVAERFPMLVAEISISLPRRCSRFRSAQILKRWRICRAGKSRLVPCGCCMASARSRWSFFIR